MHDDDGRSSAAASAAPEHQPLTFPIRIKRKKDAFSVDFVTSNKKKDAGYNSNISSEEKCRKVFIV